MCGIAGIVRYDDTAVGADMLRELSRSLAHRGPDDAGFLAWRPGSKVLCERVPDIGDSGTVGLVHRRLSIVDLTEAGWQPMLSDDGRYAIVFNGEIYNFVELRRELESLGYRFRSRSDTEVLLNAYHAWGKDALCRFVGMFAFAIVDFVERLFFLARDFMGIKPLYYCAWTDGTAFASEPGLLLAIPGISRDLDAGRMFEFAAYGRADEGSRTLFKHVHQVPAGHYVEIPLEAGSPAKLFRYWRLDPTRRSTLSFEDSAEQLREMFLDSVRLHLRSDVPVGACLSGGIDSSSVVMAMRHIEGPDLEIHTFSFIPRDKKLSEEHYVDAIGEAAGATVHKVSPTTQQLKKDLDTLILAQGEPVRGTSMYAQYRVYQLARRHGVKVLLNGQGADEMLAGYQGVTVFLRILSLLRKGRVHDAFGLAAKIIGSDSHPSIPEFVFQLIKRLEQFDDWENESDRAAFSRLVNLQDGPEWVNSLWLRDMGVRRRVSRPRQDLEVLRATLVHMIEETSMPHLLRSEDRNSMSHGVESRLPFVTPQLAQFLISLPEEHLVDNRGRSKAVFRHAMRGIVPDQILNRSDKIGFATPLSDWLLDLREWVEDTLETESNRPWSLFYPPILLERYNLATLGRAELDSGFWRGLNAIRWANLVGGVYSPVLGAD